MDSIPFSFAINARIKSGSGFSCMGAGVNPLSSGSLGHKHGFPGLETAKHAVSVRGHGGVIEFSDEGREWSIVGE